MCFGIEAVFFSMIQGAWTTFEVMVGDLWEAAINVRPKRLAALDGDGRRIEDIVHALRAADLKEGRRKSSIPPEDGIEVKKIDVSVAEIGNVSEHSFDLQGKMGTLLRTRFDFRTLRKIRDLYGRAFDKPSDPKIDEILSNRSLDALAQVRHVIVHSAGIIDREYVERTRGIPNAPKLSEGQPLRLDGELTFNLIDLAVRQAVNLLKAVDSFVSKSRQGDGAIRQS
jgi:hypothetical protein